MVVEPMPDEYYERYRHLSHQELYAMLRAGSPPQIDDLAGAWRVVQDTIESLTAGLRRDLGRLLPSWTGPGSREFQYRVGLIATYAQRLADESDAMRTGLEVMSGALVQAQRQAEQPDQTDDPAWTLDGVVGSILGHNMVEEERSKARERMAVLVAHLAAEYAVADHGSWPATIPPAPADLPDNRAAAGSGVGQASLSGTSLLGAPLARAGPLVGAAGGIGPLVGAAGGTGPLIGAAGGTGSVPADAAASHAALGGAGQRPTAASGVATGDVLGHSAGGESQTGANAQQNPMPLLGHSAVARHVDGYLIPDAKVTTDGPTAWRANGIVWNGGDETPPPVLGEAAPGSAG